MKFECCPLCVCVFCVSVHDFIMIPRMKERAVGLQVSVFF